MPDTEEIDGDVYVTPRYLAGTTWTGDPALAPLLALGWDLQHDEDGIMWNQFCQGPLPDNDPESLEVDSAPEPTRHQSRADGPWGESNGPATKKKRLAEVATAFGQSVSMPSICWILSP